MKRRRHPPRGTAAAFRSGPFSPAYGAQYGSTSVAVFVAVFVQGVVVVGTTVEVSISSLGEVVEDPPEGTTSVAEVGAGTVIVTV